MVCFEEAVIKIYILLEVLLYWSAFILLYILKP